MKYFKKKAKHSEIIALNILEELGIISKVYPPYIQYNNIILVEKCEQESIFTVEHFIDTIDFCVKNLYTNKMNFFTTGIYSFIPSSKNYFSQVNYFDNLKFELLNLSRQVRIDDEISNKLNKVLIRIDKYKEKNFQFCILHGDLHPGNIVLKNQKILLIDWEYLTIGMPEIEIAYFLVLLIIDNNYDMELLKEAILKIKDNSNMWNISFNIFYELFLPYICLCLLLCVQMNFIKNELFSDKYLRKLLGILLQT